MGAMAPFLYRRAGCRTLRCAEEIYKVVSGAPPNNFAIGTEIVGATSNVTLSPTLYSFCVSELSQLDQPIVAQGTGLRINHSILR